MAVAQSMALCVCGDGTSGATNIGQPQQRAAAGILAVVVPLRTLRSMSSHSQALAGADPTTLSFAGSSDASQQAFWQMSALLQHTRFNSLPCLQALAGADPTSLAFAGRSDASQQAFWRALVQRHCCGSEPRLNFVLQGGQGAVLTRVLPHHQARDPLDYVLHAQFNQERWSARWHWMQDLRPPSALFAHPAVVPLLKWHIHSLFTAKTDRLQLFGRRTGGRTKGRHLHCCWTQ